jgi:hypothetical protein
LRAPERQRNRRASRILSVLAGLAVVQTAALAFLTHSILGLNARMEGLSQQADSQARLAAATPAAAADYPAGSGLSAAEIRAIIREEVLTSSAGPAPAKSAAAPGQPPSAPAAGTGAVRVGDVRGQLQTYIARGRMTNADIDRFIAMASELSESERNQVLRELTAAVNSGRLEATF